MEKYLLIAFLMFAVVVVASVSFLAIYFQEEPYSEPTCFEMGGIFCEDICSTDLVSASDGLCCKGECKKPTCQDLNGYSCDSSSECLDTLLSTDNVCCSSPCSPIVPQIKTCQELNGFKCQSKSECSGNILPSSDGICCDQICEVPISFSSCTSVCSYDSLCDSSLKTDGLFSCCQNSCNIQKTPTCNYNLLCESFENSSCLDCGCNGVVCDGICYQNTLSGFSCGSIDNYIALISTDFPGNLEFDSSYRGNMILKNKLNESINISFSMKGDGVDVDSIEHNLTLSPFEELLVPISILVRMESAYNIIPIFGGLEIKRLENPSISLNGKAYYSGIVTKLSYTKSFFSYTSSASKCGNNIYSLEGKCIGDVYYFDSDCSISSGCIDGFSWWFSVPQTVKPLGKVKIAYMGVNLEKPLDGIPDMLSNVSNWYDREALKYTGKDIMDIEYVYLGDFNVTSDIISDITNPLFIEKYNTTDSYKEISGMVDLTQYDIVLVFLDDKIISSAGDFAYGINLRKFVFIQQKTEPIIAHEIAHSFGCRDVYRMNFACGSFFNFNIMCTSFFGSVAKYEMGTCASEMGWGDRDNDGIVDVEDGKIDEILPNWFSGISIDLVEKRTNTTTNEIISVVRVKDNMGGIITTPKVNFTVSGLTYPCQLYDYELKKTFYCGVIVSNLPANMTIRAEYGGFVKEQNVTFN